MANRQQPDNDKKHAYQDLRIDFDSKVMSWTNGAGQNESEIEKRVMVKNGNQPVNDCQVILEELAYHFGGEWTDPPNGYDQKALRWVDEEARAGRLTIPANRSAKLAILKVYRYPNPYFGITYGDGSYGKTHHFTGKYRLRLRVEARFNETITGQWIQPTIYEVYLSYAGTLDLEIDEIVKVSTD